MRILVVSDAWVPQVNGVVRTLATLKDELEGSGHHVVMVTPDRFRTIPCPTYPEIRLAIRPGANMARMIEAAPPSALFAPFTTTVGKPSSRMRADPPEPTWAAMASLRKASSAVS